MLGPPVRRDGFSDRDHDIKRGVGTMKYGLEIRNQNSGEPPLLSRLPVQISVSAPSVQGQGGWLVDDDIKEGL